VGGNWKMNLDRRGSIELARAVAAGLSGEATIDAAVFPPLVYLEAVSGVLCEAGSRVALGAQDAYFEASGAFTGEVSCGMARDVGCVAALAGHSERRHVLGEDDAIVAKKARAMLDAGLTCVLCVGETLAEREAGKTDALNERQTTSALSGLPAGLLGRVVIAYEPVWAIGTGRTATPADAQDAHAKIRGVLGRLFGADAAGRTRIIYGGSVKPGNAAELAACPDVDGFLVGGASLAANDFLSICRSAAGAARA